MIAQSVDGWAFGLIGEPVNAITFVFGTTSVEFVGGNPPSFNKDQSVTAACLRMTPNQFCVFVDDLLRLRVQHFQSNELKKKDSPNDDTR